MLVAFWGSPMRILFADDHQLVRQTLTLTLRRLDVGEKIEVVEAETLPELLAMAGGKPAPRLILMDLSMPGMSEVADLGQVRTAFPGVPVVVLSGFSDKQTILDCFKHGAAGFIPKSTSREEFLSALRVVLGGQRFVPFQVVDDDAGKLPTFVPQGPSRHRGQPAKADLTERECEMLGMLAQGLTNKSIGRAYDIEEVTVKLALRRLYKKIGATNRASAVRVAAEQGYL
jgi:DNA-binding NarL/FixJ family response regulator